MIKECAKPAKRSGHRNKRSAPKASKGRPDLLVPDQAMEEARRCLGLRSCESCEICSLLCPDLCITRGEAGEVKIDLEYCKGCGICAAVCPKGAIQMVLDQEG